MSHSWDDARPGQRRRRRRRPPSGAVPPVPPTSPAPSPSDPRPAGRSSGAGRERSRKTLTPEQRAYREAKAAANRKIGFLAHAIPFAAVNLMLLLVAGFRPAMIVSLTWGIGLAVHWFFAIAAPGMRQRMIDQEVRRRVHQGVSDERVSLEGDHQRRLEELSASIAHEIRNPITAAKSLVQQMGEDPAASDNVEYAKVALDELQRVEKSVAHLLRYAREEEVAVTEVRIGEVVESAIETFRDRIEQIGVTVESDVLEAGTMQGDPDKLRRVLINLLGNALDAFQESHTPSPLIAVQAGENLAGTEVWVRVRDNGPGIEPAQLERVFDPFYTSKSSGTGLGLAISKKLVDAHGGSIEAQSQPGSGTEFVITFPKAGGHPEPSRRNAAEPA